MEGKKGMNQGRMFQKSVLKETLPHTHKEPFSVAPETKKDVIKYKERLLFTTFTTVFFVCLFLCLLFTQENINREEKGRDLESQRMCQ